MPAGGEYCARFSPVLGVWQFSAACCFRRLEKLDFSGRYVSIDKSRTPIGEANVDKYGGLLLMET